MTYRQFLRELRKTPRRGWRIDSDAIRMDHSDSDMVYCPVTAVCKFLKGKEFHVGCWCSVAQELGLARTIVRRIMIASDNSLLSSALDSRLADIRIDLLRATGLYCKLQIPRR